MPKNLKMEKNRILSPNSQRIPNKTNRITNNRKPFLEKNENKQWNKRNRLQKATPQK